MPLTTPGLPGLPPELAGPVAVQLSKPVREIPLPPDSALVAIVRGRRVLAPTPDDPEPPAPEPPAPLPPWPLLDVDRPGSSQVAVLSSVMVHSKPSTQPGTRAVNPG